MRSYRENNYSNVISYNQDLRNYILKIYAYMIIGLFIAGLSAYLVVSSEFLKESFYVIEDNYLQELSRLGWMMAISPIIIVLAFYFILSRLHIMLLRILFVSYSVLLGFSLGSLFLIFLEVSIAELFFIASFIFSLMSLYGYPSDDDITSFPFFLAAGFIGVGTIFMVNVFVENSSMEFMVFIIGILVFIGITAFDIQKIENIYFALWVNKKYIIQKIPIIGAIRLYFDFINIFLHLSRVIGNEGKK